LFAGFSKHSVMGDVMGACMNGSMYTYEMAPVAILMEKAFF